MPEMFSPSMSEWTEVQSWLSDLRARTTQIELFHADSRQAKAEDTITSHETRMKSLESWRGSADATMNLAQKLGEDNGKAITVLQGADTKLAEKVDGLVTFITTLAKSVTTLTETVTAMQQQVSKLSSLEARIAACEEKLKQPTKLAQGGQDVS